MKNRKKQKISLKKITITRLQPNVISKLKGGGKGEEPKGSDPTEFGFPTTEMQCESVLQCDS